MFVSWCSGEGWLGVKQVFQIRSGKVDGVDLGKMKGLGRSNEFFVVWCARDG